MKLDRRSSSTSDFATGPLREEFNDSKIEPSNDFSLVDDLEPGCVASRLPETVSEIHINFALLFRTCDVLNKFLPNYVLAGSSVHQIQLDFAQFPEIGPALYEQNVAIIVLGSKGCLRCIVALPGVDALGDVIGVIMAS